MTIHFKNQNKIPETKTQFKKRELNKNEMFQETNVIFRNHNEMLRKETL